MTSVRSPIVLLKSSQQPEFLVNEHLLHQKCFLQKLSEIATSDVFNGFIVLVTFPDGGFKEGGGPPPPPTFFVFHTQQFVSVANDFVTAIE